MPSGPSPPPGAEGIRPLTRPMAALLWVAGGLVFLAGVQLFVFTERTDRFFAWTIDPPLTAAFLGASYWSSVVFEWRAARARTWAEARVAVPAVFVFTVSTLVVTLVHLERFHLGASFAGGTQAVTWAWIAVYATVPVLMGVLFLVQARVPGAEPVRQRRLPAPLRAAAAAEAAVLAAAGIALLAAPGRAGWWPWPLTPLTARAVGAWLLSLALAAAHARWEDDAARVAPAAAAFVSFAVLQGVALARYPDALDWTGPKALLYAAFLAASLATGLAALQAGRSAGRGARWRGAPVAGA